MTEAIKRDLVALYNNLSNVIADTQAANRKINDRLDELPDEDDRKEAENEEYDELQTLASNLDDAESELATVLSYIEEFAP